MLVPRSREWREDAGAQAALEQVQAQPWVEAVIQEGDRTWLRLTDEWVAGRGAEIEQGPEGVAGCGEAAAGRRFALNFWDANSTKALHIGHLRNLALGNALGNARTEAGGEVERRSIICDIGRSMGEAMAGVVRSGKYPQGGGEGSGVKPDHFVGYCYADYGLDGTTSVQVCGQEWFAHVTCRRQLMAELVHTGEGNGFHPYHDIFHGMVAREREKIASSKKDAVLIDHLVEWVDEQIEADAGKSAIRRGHPDGDRVPSQVALGFFLLHSSTRLVAECRRK